MAHFKRSDVTIAGDEIKIHSYNERDPIPIVLHHHPVCVSFAIYENGYGSIAIESDLLFFYKVSIILFRDIAIADPSLLEERRSEANLVFGINAYRELCGLHFGGITLASLEMLLKCANQGSKRAKNVVKYIKAALEADEKCRLNGDAVGFMPCLQSTSFDSHNETHLLLRLEKFKLNTTHEMEVELEQMKQEQAKIKSLGQNSAVLLPPEELSDDDENDQWIPELDNDIDDELYVAKASNSKENQAKPADEEVKSKKTATKRKSTKNSSLDDDSEEEETIVMERIT